MDDTMEVNSKDNLLHLYDTVDEEHKITLKCGSKVYYSHKTLLVAKSEYFALAFRSEFVERKTQIFEIKDTDVECVEAMILHLNTGRYDVPAELGATVKTKLLFHAAVNCLADYYGARDLREFSRNQFALTATGETFDHLTKTASQLISAHVKHMSFVEMNPPNGEFLASVFDFPFELLHVSDRIELIRHVYNLTPDLQRDLRKIFEAIMMYKGLKFYYLTPTTSVTNPNGFRPEIMEMHKLAFVSDVLIYLSPAHRAGQPGPIYPLMSFSSSDLVNSVYEHAAILNDEPDDTQTRAESPGTSMPHEWNTRFSMRGFAGALDGPAPSLTRIQKNLVSVALHALSNEAGNPKGYGLREIRDSQESFRGLVARLLDGWSEQDIMVDLIHRCEVLTTYPCPSRAYATSAAFIHILSQLDPYAKRGPNIPQMSNRQVKRDT